MRTIQNKNVFFFSLKFCLLRRYRKIEEDRSSISFYLLLFILYSLLFRRNAPLRAAPLRRKEVSHLEAGAVSAGKVPMAIDFRFREAGPQHPDKVDHRLALRRRAGVAWLAVLVKPADVADADAASVLALAMGACIAEWLANLDGAVEVDDVVIAAVRASAAGEPTFLVPLLNVLFLEVQPLFCGRTVEYNLCYLSHCRNLLLLCYLLLLKLLVSHPSRRCS